MAPIQQKLPRRGAAAIHFELAREVLFRDHDVLMLFNVSLDGIEDDCSELAECYRFANLRRQTTTGRCRSHGAEAPAVRPHNLAAGPKK